MHHKLYLERIFFMYKSIRKKLIIYIIPIITLVLVLSYFINISNSKKIVEQEIFQTIDTKKDEQSRYIEDIATKIKGDSDVYASSISSSYHSLNADIYNQILTNLLIKDTSLRSAAVWFDPYVTSENQSTERYLVENIDGSIVVHEDYQSPNLNYLNHYLYLRAKKLNNSFFTEAYFSDVLGTYTITYVTPIQNSNGEFIGCFSSSFDIKLLKELVDEYNTDFMYFYILDNSGVYIAHTDLELVKSKANFLDLAEGDKYDTEKLQTIFNTDSGSITFTNNGVDYYIYYDTVTSFEWKLIYQVPALYVKQPLIQLTLLNILICSVVLAILIFIILYVSNKFVHKPLQLLVEDFKNISSNNLNSDIPNLLVDTESEFSEIGKALFEMKRNLAEYQSSLNDKNELLVANEQSLKNTVDYINAIITALPIMMFIFDKDGYCLELYGPTPFSKNPPEFFKGKHCLELLSVFDQNAVDVHEFFDIIKNIDYSDGVVNAQVSFKIDGNMEYFNHSLTLCRDNMVISLSKRVTDTVNHIKDMKYLSDFDELTGLYNSRYFIDMLKQHVEHSSLPISIIVCDVNGLKALNDKYGFDVGDKILLDLTVALNNIDIANKTVSRAAADEFAIVLPNTTKLEAENIIENISSQCILGKVSKISFSLGYGVDTKTTKEGSLLQLIKSVEELLYKQKVYTSSGEKDNSIGLINSILHAKNKREQLHSDRVSEFCLAMAKALGWSQVEQNKLSTAGLLHDIGKIGISEAILNKPGKLTDGEYAEMCTHPEIGYNILQSFENMKELAEYAYSHHEKWDGTGYPRKLKGSEIPVEARILAIIDTFDAMTSSRSYREGLPQEVAVAELIKCKNTQFDPELVDIFVEKVLFEKLEDYQG